MADLKKHLVGLHATSFEAVHPNFQMFDSEYEFAQWRQDGRRGMGSEEVYAYIRSLGALYGTASGIEETVQGFLDSGCKGYIVFCNAARR